MADAVDSFRRISWLVFKWLLIALGAVIALIAAIVGLTYAYQWYTVDRHIPNVVFKVMVGKESICKTDTHPIFVGVINNSGRTIEKVYFRLRANLPGRSSDLARYHSYSDDKIIGPTEVFGMCWAFPELEDKTVDPTSLEWAIEYKRIAFKD